MPTDHPTPGSLEWLRSVEEPIVDPAREIVDPHHHLWANALGRPYLLSDLWADTGSGHNVVQTVFVECGASYRSSGPEELRPVGETEFVADIADESERGSGATIAGIVAHADLRLDTLDDVLDAHEAAGRGRFRGIRHAGSRAEHPEALLIPGRAPEGLYADTSFRRGLRRLGARGLSYDTWHYWYQTPALTELASAVPDTPIVFDHFGTPLGVGPYAGRRDEIFQEWKKGVTELASCPNVVAKLGGLAMPDNGFGWHERPTPPTSDEFVAAQRDYYLHTIECFGPDRCMFESNFPVDKLSIAYPILYNGLKKIVADFSEAEKDQLFSGTARRVYRI